MTAKEKALALIKKFDKLLPCEGTTTGETPIDCALIAVNEVLFALYDIDKKSLNFTDYWEEVKQEIKKL